MIKTKEEFEDKLVDLVADYAKNGGDIVNGEINVDIDTEDNNGVTSISLTALV
jgi:hypothetical protein